MGRFVFISPRHFEPWYWASPDDPGIGGSETMHCELVRRLAARGHQVTSYAPVPAHIHDTTHQGVLWRHLDSVDYTQHGIWVLVRGIEWLDRFTPHDGQRVWCVFQDVDTFGPWEDAWLDKVDRIVGLCTSHVDYLQSAHPTFTTKIYQSRNGLRGDLVDETLARSDLVRNPHRLTYASSPDRGLYGLLQAWRLIRFLVPDAELHVCYGFDNLMKVQDRAAIQWSTQRILKALDQPGVIQRGRLGQRALYAEWAQTGVLCAPTNFTETGYITLMEAQALGAIPVVNPIWAARENQLAGIAIEGEAERTALTLRRYAMAAAYLMQHPEVQESMRPAMMADARKRFDWEGVADQYVQWAQEDVHL